MTKITRDNLDKLLYEARKQGFIDGITGEPYNPPTNPKLAGMYGAGYTRGETHE